MTVCGFQTVFVVATYYSFSIPKYLMDEFNFFESWSLTLFWRSIKQKTHMGIVSYVNFSYISLELLCIPVFRGGIGIGIDS